MTPTQTPLGSGFTSRSTATDVLAGIDLTGTTAVVTGGYSGLGLESTRALAAAGAHVIVPARDLDRAQLSLEGIAGVDIHALDLADLHSVESFADGVLASGRDINILIANAGIMACPLARVGPGWESQFAVNHLGHFALVNRLWPALARGQARVIVVSSGAHAISGIRWHDIHFAVDSDYDRWQAYGQSKTANVLFAVHLDERGREHGVRAFAVHPGSILTPLQRHFSHQEKVDLGWIDEQGELADPSFKTPEQGAATQVWAATSPLLEGRGALYCIDSDVAPAQHVRPHATDPDQAARLWALSADLTGVDALVL